MFQTLPPPILPNSASEKSSFEKREIEMSEMCKKSYEGEGHSRLIRCLAGKESLALNIVPPHIKHGKVA